MGNENDIATGELFADLQVTLTEIVLIELLEETSSIDNYVDRLNGNVQIRDTIKGIMRRRFAHTDIARFLDHGFPRQVNLAQTIYNDR